MRQNPKAIPFDALHQCICTHGVSLVHCTHINAEQAEVPQLVADCRWGKTVWPSLASVLCRLLTTGRLPPSRSWTLPEGFGAGLRGSTSSGPPSFRSFLLLLPQKAKVRCWWCLFALLLRYISTTTAHTSYLSPISPIYRWRKIGHVEKFQTSKRDRFGENWSFSTCGWI